MVNKLNTVESAVFFFVSSLKVDRKMVEKQTNKQKNKQKAIYFITLKNYARLHYSILPYRYNAKFSLIICKNLF